MDKIVQPKPVVRFEIAQSLNGNKIVYIARDPGGIVRLRAENLETLEKMIFEYRLPEPPKPSKDNEEVIKAKIDDLVETVVATQAEEEEKKSVKKPTPVGTAEEIEANLEKKTEEKKQFLKNELQETIEEQREKSTKKSFWDRLK